MERACGVLLHITSLASDEGIGSLDGAVGFLDFLKRAGVRYWQILPLNIPDASNSPYSSMSAFAFYPALIGIKQPPLDGFTANDGADGVCVQGFDPKVALAAKERLFRTAFSRFNGSREYDVFKRVNAYWLKDYSLYAALKTIFDCDWTSWREEYKFRDKKTLAAFSNVYGKEVEYRIFEQFLFFNQWQKLRSEAKKRSIKIIGDMPYYVSYNSADVWANPRCFKLNPDLSPSKVSGVPPDYFSPDGQLWGNPVYDWEAMRENGYEWWLMRVRQARGLFDCLRIDHFRAFDAYWEVDAARKNARKGKWIKCESDIVSKLIDEAGRMKIIAEDLGVQSESLGTLMKTHSLPGMKVLQFAFDGRSGNVHLPHNYNENCAAYLGTHDNATTAEWWREIDTVERDRVYSYAGFETDGEINRKLMKLLCRSNAGLVVFSVQDIINSDKRMNVPGTSCGNWEFMLEKDALSESDAEYLKGINRMFGRFKD